MKKMIFILIPFIINLIICGEDGRCLEENEKSNTNKIYLSTCLTHNIGTKNRELLKNEKYCCLLTMTYENKTTNTYCMTTFADKDVIEERIDMFKYQKDIKEVSIDCSSNYLIITFLFLFLLII